MTFSHKMGVDIDHVDNHDNPNMNPLHVCDWTLLRHCQDIVRTLSGRFNFYSCVYHVAVYLSQALDLHCLICILPWLQLFNFAISYQNYYPDRVFI